MGDNIHGNGPKFKVTIEFSTDEIDYLGIYEIIRDNFGKDSVETYHEELTGNKLEMIWVVPENEGVHEIENALYYILDDGRLGTYTWVYTE